MNNILLSELGSTGRLHSAICESDFHRKAAQDRRTPKAALLRLPSVVLALCSILFGFSLSAADSKQDQVAKLSAVLQSNADQKAKADACRELARIGTKDSVPALAALLGDEQLGHMARYGLETISDPSVDRALEQALQTLHGRPLVGVIGSIGARRDSAAVKPLSKLVTSSDSEVVQATARALGKIGTTASAKALQAAIKSATPNDQLAMFEGLFRCAESLEKHGNQTAATGIYDWVRRQNPQAHQVRTAALRGAILSREQAGLPMLREALAGADFLDFAAAAKISRDIPGDAVTRALTDELSKSRGDKALLLLGALGFRHDPAALPSIYKLARAGEKPSRLLAIKTISAFGDSALVLATGLLSSTRDTAACDSAVPLFVDLLADSDSEIVRTAAEALAAWPTADADAAILKLLNSSNPEHRSLGLDLVARRRMVSALPDVLALAHGNDPPLRVTAVRKLGELAGPREFPTLLMLLQQAESPVEVEAAERAIGSVIAKTPKPEDYSETLATEFAKSKTAQKCALMRLLGSTGGGPALRTARQAVKDPSSEVRTTAIRTLGNWNNADPAGDLLDLAKTCADGGEKALALRSYLSLARQAEIPEATRLTLCREAAQLVQQPDEKKQLLAALGEIALPESVTLLSPYLDDAVARSEAALACVSVADKLLQFRDANKNAPQLIEPLQKAAQAGAGDDTTKRAQSLLEEAKKKAAAAK